MKQDILDLLNSGTDVVVSISDNNLSGHDANMTNSFEMFALPEGIYQTSYNDTTDMSLTAEDFNDIITLIKQLYPELA